MIRHTPHVVKVPWRDPQCFLAYVHAIKLFIINSLGLAKLKQKKGQHNC